MTGGRVWLVTGWSGLFIKHVYTTWASSSSTSSSGTSSTCIPKWNVHRIPVRWMKILQGYHEMMRNVWEWDTMSPQKLQTKPCNKAMPPFSHERLRGDTKHFVSIKMSQTESAVLPWRTASATWTNEPTIWSCTNGFVVFWMHQKCKVFQRIEHRDQGEFVTGYSLLSYLSVCFP